MPGKRRVGAVLRGVAVDLTPLRASRDYRLMWFGSLVSETGGQISLVAVFFQVYRLTNSPAAVGLLGLAQLAPLIVGSIAAAPLADRMDRRRLLLIAESLTALTSLMLLLLAFSSRPPLFAIYIAWALRSAVRSVSSPTRSAMVPNLVGHSLIPQAQALSQVMWNTAQVVGPALGGVVIARTGLRWAYAIDALSFSATIVMVMMMRPMRPASESSTTRRGAIIEGFRFLKGHRIIQSTFIVDLVAMIFGMPRALFPVLAITQFHGGENSAEIQGLLFAAPAAGALVAALTAGWVGRIRHQGRAVLWAVALWGAGITAFGLSGRSLVLALFFLGLAGAADVISAVFRSTILQVSSPDELRGRLSGLHIMVVAGGPRLGDIEAGVVAQAFSPLVSVVSGGLACIAGVAVLAVAVPEFRRYRLSHPVETVVDDAGSVSE